MSDVERQLLNAIIANWDEDLKVQFITEERSHDYRVPGIKVYLVDTMSTASQLGYGAVDLVSRLTVDVRAADRETAFDVLDELESVLRLIRKSTVGDYNRIDIEDTRKQSGYSDFYHFTIDVKMYAYAKVI